MTFSERAVEAAAKALRERDMAGRITVPWGKIQKGQKKKWIERGQAALTAALAVDGLALQGWQPIETAPKDGRMFIIGRDASSGHAYAGIGIWRDEKLRDPTDFPARMWNRPTHWQPLPAPPLTAASDGEVG